MSRVKNGEQALKAAVSKKPDLILLAVLLPKKNGFEVLEELKKKPESKNIPIILLTKLGTKEDVKRGLKLGAADYVIKGHFRPSEVVDKVKKFCR